MPAATCAASSVADNTTASNERTPLKLEKTMELPNVQGQSGHRSLDLKVQRLFVSALGNDTALLGNGTLGVGALHNRIARVMWRMYRRI